jgi:hypothetical protein
MFGGIAMTAPMLVRRARGRVFALAAVAMIAAVAGCDDSTDPEDEHELHVETMRLTVGTQVVSVTDGVVTGGPLVLEVGANTVTAEFLDEDGVPDPHVTPAEFQLNVSIGLSDPFSFTRSMTNPFSGTILAAAPVTGSSISFALFHIEEQHDDFGPFPVPVNVN